MDVTSPKDGKVIARVAVSGPEDVADAVRSGQEAFKKWSQLTTKARVQILLKIHALIRDNADRLADSIVLEHGKNKTEALASVSKGNETVEWACSLPQLIGGKSLEVSRGVECKEWREPIGVVSSIVPFNFPIMVPMWTLPIAIGCGNTYILKPSEKVPITMSLVVELFKEAGLPEGVVNIVNGTAEVVEAICDNDGIKAVTFVGSTKVAEIVAKRCRARNKKVLALGGAKNHLVSMPDCNIEMASQDIVNSFTGCGGQRCMAASVLLTVGKQPKLLAAIVEKAKKLVPGDKDRQIGPVIDEMSLAKITRYINEAESGGAEILLDGRGWTKENKIGHWIGPTIILHSKRTDPALHDEIFGPTLSIYEAKNKEEAIEIENANPYGNAACIYTSVGAHAEWFTKRFGAGMIGVNIGVPVPREPFSFGGINNSKFGDMDITGDGAMEFFTSRRKVTTKWDPPQDQSWMS